LSFRAQQGSVSQYSSPLGLVIDKAGTSRTHYTRDNKGDLIGQRNPDGTRWYYLKDGLGSVVAVINEAGTTIGHRYGYDAWGKQTTQSGTVANPWGYASGYLDTTGLIKFGTRYYDPNLGRWTQQDPIGNPNRYAYVNDNPVGAVDPSGSWSRSCTWWGCTTRVTEQEVLDTILLVGIIGSGVCGFIGPACGLVFAIGLGQLAVVDIVCGHRGVTIYQPWAGPGWIGC
jgi:RHS repeat-associated protein